MKKTVVAFDFGASSGVPLPVLIKTADWNIRKSTDLTISR